MNCNIKTSDGRLVGLNEIVYKLTPPAQSDFKYSVEIEFDDEPDNLIEEIRTMGNIVLRLFRI